MPRMIPEVYTTSIHEGLRLYATWPIGTELELGDFGRLENYLFIKEGNIAKTYRIPVKVKDYPRPVFFEFKSLGTQGISDSLPGSRESERWVLLP